MKYYQVMLDNNRKKFLWAKNKKDLLAKCLEEYPEATVTGIWVDDENCNIRKWNKLS